MRYLLLVYGSENELTDGERRECYKESAQLACDLRASGQFIATAPLHPTASATSVRIRSGKVMITDGPFAETREQLGGFFMVDAPNLDEAIAIAQRIPTVRRGTIEVRPVLEVPGLP